MRAKAHEVLTEGQFWTRNSTVSESLKESQYEMDHKDYDIEESIEFHREWRFSRRSQPAKVHRIEYEISDETL